MLRKQYFKTIIHSNTYVTGFSISAEEGGSKTCLMKEEGSAQEQRPGKLFLKKSTKLTLTLIFLFLFWHNTPAF